MLEVFIWTSLALAGRVGETKSYAKIYMEYFWKWNMAQLPSNELSVEQHPELDSETFNLGLLEIYKGWRTWCDWFNIQLRPFFLLTVIPKMWILGYLVGLNNP